MYIFSIKGDIPYGPYSCDMDSPFPCPGKGTVSKDAVQPLLSKETA